MLSPDGPPEPVRPARPARPAGALRAGQAMAAAAAIGPFFALGAEVTGTGWRPAADRYRPGSDPLLTGGAGPLADAEPRVAASIQQLGFAARLWSPVLGCGLLAEVVPDLASLQIHAADCGGPARLALAEPRGWLASDPEHLAELSYREVVQTHLEPLARSLRGRLAAGLLWGNAASAMAGALGVLVLARPDLREQAAVVASALLDTGRLRGTGRLDASGTGLGFRRRSCCLFYRLPGGGLCADCCLSRPPGAG